MTEHLGYLFAGIGGGAVVAALALGLVLCYRTSGVVNFGQAAMGAYVALAYYEFREHGDVVLPIVGITLRFHLLTSPTVVASLAYAVVLAAALGAAVYWLVFRPLRRAPTLARVVASLGLMLYLQEAARLLFPVSGASAVRRRPVLPDGAVHLFGTTVTANRLLLALFAIVTAALLAAVFRFTRFGLRTRAAATNEKGALLAGVSSDRVALANWMIASVITGLAVILIEPIAGLDPAMTALLVMPALAAALLGGLQSFAVATAAGLSIGMVQALILGEAVRPDVQLPSWLPTTGLQQAVPVLLILVALVWRGNALPDRSAVSEHSLPRAPVARHPVIWLVICAGSASIGLLVFDAALRQALVVSMVFAFLALSVVVITGFVGQISLAQLSFAGLAGFTVIALTDRGLPFPFAALIACAVATAAGILVGLPAVRVRGMSLAIATLAVAIAIEQLVLASEPFTGGSAGRTAPTPSLFGLDIGFFAPGSDNFRPAFGFVVLATLALCCLAVANVRRNRTGLRWLAVRSNERAAAAAGIDVGRAKLGAFALSSFLAGLCGVFMATSTPRLSPTSFLVVGALVAVALTYLGGISSIAGALVAGLLAQAGLLTIAMNDLTDGSSGPYVFAISGLALMVTAVLAPEGITGLVRRLPSRVRRSAGTRTRSAAPEPDTVAIPQHAST